MADFGQELRRLRKEAGLSLRGLDARSGIPFGYIGQIERGARWCSPAWAEILDQTLDAKGALLRLHHENGRDRGEDVQRRAMLRTLTGIAVGVSSPTIALEALRHGLDRAADPDHDEWQEIATQYGYDFYTVDHETLGQQAAADLVLLQQLMVDHSDDTQLSRAAAQISAVLALTLAHTGQRLPARRWWITARRHADQSGDIEIRVRVRSHDAVCGLYDGRPLDQVLRLTDETLALAAGRACAGTAGVLAGRAQALALADRHDEAAAALRAVEEVTSRIPAHVAADAASAWGWPEHRLRHTESYVYALIGRTDAAMAAQDRAVQMYPDNQARLRTQVELHRAICLIRDGHISNGLCHAADRLDALPPEHRNETLYEVVRQVARFVPPPERRRAEFDDLRERIPARPARQVPP